MKRHSFFLTVAAAAVVWGSGAMEARADSVLLSSLLGTTVDINGVNFTFDSYTSNIIPANQVTITFPVVGSTAPGFVLTGPFGALAGATDNSELIYTASLANPSGSITAMELNGNPFSSGTGVESVTNTAFAGTSPTGPILAQIAIASNTTVGPVTGTFATAQSTITIATNLNSVGGSGGTSLSAAVQSLSGVFPPVPEPNTMALLGIGMASLLAYRRLIKRNRRLLSPEKRN